MITSTQSSDKPNKPEDHSWFLQSLLEEQQELTAVEEFAKEFEEGKVALEVGFQRLIPVRSPRENEQYAFEVDLDRCSGCKSCVAACHSQNGLDPSEAFRDVGLLTGGSSKEPFLQHVTMACHHCVEPACMQGCPVNAYEKDPVTGIVKHLDDQCFGCQYCTLACPYDVPKYNASKGIVRKCDMCSQRLAVGQAPACAAACPHEAISIQVVDKNDVIENAEVNVFLPAAPHPAITLPTTHYKTKRVFPRNTVPADYYSANPQHPHWPLIVMLVLTQLSVGAFVVSLVLSHTLQGTELGIFHNLLNTTALGFGLMALGASTLHLGRPQYAFRAILGVRHSWLSREIIFFGAFAFLATLYSGVGWIPESWLAIPKALMEWLAWFVAATGFMGVFCSVMIYAKTKKETWHFSLTFSKFVLSAGVLGIAACWFVILWISLFDEQFPLFLVKQNVKVLVFSMVLVSTLKLLLELSQLRHLWDHTNSAKKRSARLLVGQLSNSTFARFSTGILGGIVMPIFVYSEFDLGAPTTIPLLVGVGMMFCACLAGELLERFQFFSACASSRMPGSIS